MSYVKHNIVSGYRFGHWTVLKEVGRHPSTDRLMYALKCDCGNEKVVQRSHLVSGKSTSCGCYAKEASVKHGLRNHPLYKTWSHMMDRCNNPKNKSYRDYGARGISVCKEWSGDNGLANFIRDMKEKPGQFHSIDRIDNDRGYSKDNCRWVTRDIQNKNTRKNIHIEYDGRIAVARDWDRISGFSGGTVRRRIVKGWTIEEALTTPVREGNY